jgi:SulP family sulfate permease
VIGARYPPGMTVGSGGAPRSVPSTDPRWARLLPGVWQLRTYRRPWLRGDLIAGLAVAAYLVPQVMAYAELAGLSAVQGLWAAVGPLLLYAIFGSSRNLSVGPESTTALMTAVAIATVTGGNSALAASAAAVLAVAVGLVCVVGWLARLGYVSDLLSKPVLTGYMAGIAVLMIVSQLGKITGLQVPSGTTISEIGYVATHLGGIHLPTLILGSAVVILLLVGRVIRPGWPWVLIVMIAAAIVVAVSGADRFGLSVVGEIPRGLPVPSLPQVTELNLVEVMLAAVGIAAVGFTDNVLTGRAFADRDDPIDANQELLALGTANVSAGLLQGFPVSSSGSRTAVLVSSGGRSQLAALTALVIVIATLLFLGPLLAAFPMAALGGVVVYAATRLVDVDGFRRLARFRTSELLLALATTVAVLTVDVLYGIGIAIGLSMLNLLRRIVRPHDAVLGFAPGVAGMHDVDDYPTATQIPGLLVYRYDAPLFFADAENFRQRAVRSVDQAAEPVRWFVLNAEANTEIDFTAVDTLEQLRAELADQGITLALARVKFEVLQDLERAGLVDAIGRDHVFATLPTAVEAYRAWSSANPVTT